MLEHAAHNPNQDVIHAKYPMRQERILPLTEQASELGHLQRQRA